MKLTLNKNKTEDNQIYKSNKGVLVQGNSIELLQNDKELSKLKGKVNLIVT